MFQVHLLPTTPISRCKKDDFLATPGDMVRPVKKQPIWQIRQESPSDFEGFPIPFNDTQWFFPPVALSSGCSSISRLILRGDSLQKGRPMEIIGTSSGHSGSKVSSQAENNTFSKRESPSESVVRTDILIIMI